VLDGGSGVDAMAGGLGNDTYVVDEAADRVTEYANEGTDTVLAGIDYVLGDHLENLTLTGSADLDATGNALDNMLSGNSGNNLLDGGAGADRLVGGLGDDTYLVDGIGDIVIEAAGEGVDTVVADVSHSLAANVETLRLSGAADLGGTGNGGDNTLIGNGGANTLSGEAGDDVLDGGLGADAMLGGAGDDLYLVDDAGDVVVEAADAGSDTVHASVGHALSANVEHLVLIGSADLSGTGNALDNVLIGNAGNNVLEGGDGNDLLKGGGGSDLLRGGGGEDRYAFDPGDGNDRIADARGFNALELGGGLGAAAIDAERIGDDMLIRLRGRADAVTLEDWFSQTATDGINAITFADGTRLDRDGIEALLNRPPVANPDLVTAYEDGGPLLVPADTLLANDTDPNPGDTLAVVAVGESFLGAEVSLENGRVSYDIGSRFQELGSGQIVRDRFGYTVMDRKGETASAWVDVDIVGVNDAPVVVKPLADQDLTFNKAFFWQLPADSFEDVDGGDVLSYTATLADGSALPAWLHFDAETLAFSGVAPRKVTALEIRVTVTDRPVTAAGAADSLTGSDVFTLTIGHGNEGLGNGQDSPPAGHATNMNDGSAASVGSPGARTRGRSAMPPGTSATDVAAPPIAAARPSSRPEAGADSGRRHRAATTSDPIAMSSDLCIFDRGQPGPAATKGLAGVDEASIFAQWLAIERAMSRRLEHRDAAAWLDDGADVAVLSSSTSGYLGSTTRFGRDAISLAGGGFLQAFTGLTEGVRRIG
jgi:VCBS repeat-containing protein